MKYVLATTNEGKLKEFRELFKEMNLDIELISMDSYEIGEIIEDGNTFEENSIIKAKTVGKITKLPTIADDSGLMIKSLDNFPGIHTARIFPELKTYKEKSKKLIEMVNEKNMDREAKFVCVITLYYPEIDEVKTFYGEALGEILYELKGENGHGYDPLFYSYELKKGFAEANMEEKNKHSHRYYAFKKLVEYLKK